MRVRLPKAYTNSVLVMELNTKKNLKIFLIFQLTPSSGYLRKWPLEGVGRRKCILKLKKSEVFHLRFLQYMGQNPQENAELVKFTEKILNGKFHFLCNVNFLQCSFPSLTQNISFWLPYLLKRHECGKIDLLLKKLINNSLLMF